MIWLIALVVVFMLLSWLWVAAASRARRDEEAFRMRIRQRYGLPPY